MGHEAKGLLEIVLFLRRQDCEIHPVAGLAAFGHVFHLLARDRCERHGHQIFRRSTLERLRGVVDLGHGSERDIENMIEAHPNLKGIFSVNDVGAMGSLSAIQASGKDIKLTSVDGAPDAVKAIASGGPFIETTAQFPRDMVRIGLGLALAKYWGAHIPKAVPINVEVVDKSNAKSFSW